MLFSTSTGIYSTLGLTTIELRSFEKLHFQFHVNLGHLLYKNRREKGDVGPRKITEIIYGSFPINKDIFAFTLCTSLILKP